MPANCRSSANKIHLAGNCSILGRLVLAAYICLCATHNNIDIDAENNFKQDIFFDYTAKLHSKYSYREACHRFIFEKYFNGI